MGRNHEACRSILATIFIGGLALAPASAWARDGDDFSYLAGSWSGSGKVMGDNGAESIRCRVTYAVSPDKLGLNQTLVCASASYKFDIFSNIVDKGGSISGQWTERTRNIVGSVTGSVRGDEINTEVSAPGFQASLGVTTRGNSQSVVIHPKNYSISEVRMTLTHSR